MMKRTVQGLVLLAAWSFSIGGAQAREINFDVFALAGGSTLVDAQYFTSADRLYHTRFEVGPKYTFGVEVPYGKIFGIESSYTWGTNNLVLTNTNLFPHVGTVFPADVYIGSLSGVFHAPFSRFHLHPYGEGGVEWDRFSPTAAAIALAKNQGWGAVSTANITHNSKLGLNLGVGVERKFTKRLSFRLDVRDHITSSPAFGLPAHPTFDSDATYPVAGRLNNIAYTAGILLHLGK